MKSSFVYIRLFSAAAWRMTPSLPQRGKQSKGSIPLTPSFFQDIFQPYQELSQQGGCPSGGGGSMKSWNPQERLFVSMRISTEPKIEKILEKIILLPGSPASVRLRGTVRQEGLYLIVLIQGPGALHQDLLLLQRWMPATPHRFRDRQQSSRIPRTGCQHRSGLSPFDLLHALPQQIS